MKTRTDLLNHLAQKYNLQYYLELGVQVPELNFDKIICPFKTGVDPDPAARANVQMTSDEFFASKLLDKDGKPFIWDLIFIDGLHTAEQVKKDFENALKYLSPNGFIVLHDLLPESYERTIVPRPTPRGSWNGDCYKFGCKLGLLEDFNTVDIDNGCGVWCNGGGYYIPSPKEWTWKEFSENKKEILNVISWEQFTCSHDDPDNSGLCIKCSIVLDEGFVP